LKVGAPLSLTGRYAVQGRSARKGLEAWASDSEAALVIRDDESSPKVAAAVHRQLARECSLVLGPYGSDLTRAVASGAEGGVVWNHGAAADDVQRLPGVVSVPSPASQYLVAVARVVASLRPQAAICVLTAPGRFASFARQGIEAAAPDLNIMLASDPAAADALLLCGPIGWEIKHIRRHRREGLVIGAVSPGLAEFPNLFEDDPEGLLAPVQWHPTLSSKPEIGPAIGSVPDYVAAQAYAVALIGEHCQRLEPSNPLAAAKQLDTTTYFGRYRLANDGLQIGHRLAVIQWKNGQPQLRPYALEATEQKGLA
jgi:ABC-type branched-subunit amino acid transport system substrate-binding protein